MRKIILTLTLMAVLSIIIYFLTARESIQPNKAIDLDQVSASLAPKLIPDVSEANIPFNEMANRNAVDVFPKDARQEINQNDMLSKIQQINSELDKLPILYTEWFPNGGSMDVVKTEEINNGEQLKVTYRFGPSSYGSILYGIVGGTETGYNFNYQEHPYSNYEVDVLKELTQQNDREAALMLANKLSQEGEGYKEKISAYETAAKLGFTSGYEKIARIYFSRNDLVMARAYQLIALETAPELVKVHIQNEIDRLNDQEKENAFLLSREIKIRLSN